MSSPVIIDGKTWQVVGLVDGHDQYQAVVGELLCSLNAPWPSDGQDDDMCKRVRMVLRTSPQARSAAGLRAKHAVPEGLTTQERRNWIDGQGQIRG